VSAKDTLTQVHEKMAGKMLELLDSPELTAAQMKEIREFLKDNGIDCDAKPGTPVAALAGKLPFVGDNVTSLPERRT
jgi:hypothetical protein